MADLIQMTATPCAVSTIYTVYISTVEGGWVSAFNGTALIDEFHVTRLAMGLPAAAGSAGRQYQLELAAVYPGVRNRPLAVDRGFVNGLPAE